MSRKRADQSNGAVGVAWPYRIEAMIGLTLEGEARIDWRKDGIVWRLDVPATSISSEDAPVEFLPEGMASELLAIYQKWLALSSRSGSYPPPSAIDISRSGEADRLFLVALEPAQKTAFFRYLYIGRALAQFERPDKGGYGPVARNLRFA